MEEWGSKILCTGGYIKRRPIAHQSPKDIWQHCLLMALTIMFISWEKGNIGGKGTVQRIRAEKIKNMHQTPIRVVVAVMVLKSEVVKKSEWEGGQDGREEGCCAKMGSCRKTNYKREH